MGCAPPVVVLVVMPLTGETTPPTASSGVTPADLTERAKALNSERMVLVGPDGLDGAGKPVSGVFTAAASASSPNALSPIS